MKNMNRGGLKVPDDACCQWTILCYIMFYAVKDVACLNSLIKIFALVSKSYSFDITDIQCRQLCNIFFKNYSLLYSPRSDKETKLKVLKLSAYLILLITSILLLWTGLKSACNIHSLYLLIILFTFFLNLMTIYGIYYLLLYSGL